MKKVDFIIAGFQKCGTTSLSEWVSKHPSICFSINKEPHFFSITDDWEKKLTNYHELFKKQNTVVSGYKSKIFNWLQVVSCSLFSLHGLKS